MRLVLIKVLWWLTFWWHGIKSSSESSYCQSHSGDDFSSGPKNVTDQQQFYQQPHNHTRWTFGTLEFKPFTASLHGNNMTFALDRVMQKMKTLKQVLFYELIIESVGHYSTATLNSFLTYYKTKLLQIQFTCFKAKHVPYANWHLAARIMLYKKDWFSSILPNKRVFKYSQTTSDTSSLKPNILWKIYFSHYDPSKSFNTTKIIFSLFSNKREFISILTTSLTIS